MFDNEFFLFDYLKMVKWIKEGFNWKEVEYVQCEKYYVCLTCVNVIYFHIIPEIE